jgi:DNA-directed RNA polymerase specialized sigma24 family protein
MAVDFESFAVERGPGLVRLAHALCADFGLAEDLVQDVLLKVHRDWARINGLDARDSYVRRMLTNEFLSWRRKWGRVVPVAEVSLRDQDDHSATVAERDLLRSEVSRLPRRQQVVLAEPVKFSV